MSDAEQPEAQVKALRRGVISLVPTLAIMALLLFVPAGTPAWSLAWWFLAAFVVCTVIAIAVMWRVNPDIFVARARVQAGTKSWDYIFIALVVGGITLVLPVAGLDFRFGWSSMPGWLVGLGYIAFFIGYAGQVWAQGTNRHFEPGVRLQQDRGHKVIDTGPYALIRHPGYVTGSLLAIGMALMLGSWWALVPALVATVAFIPRTLFEERMLRDGLPGYTEYTQRVRYRWVPGVW